MSSLAFPGGSHVRTRGLLPIAVATLVGAVGTSIAYTVAYLQISDDALPELALVNKLGIGAVSLRGEYGEFVLNPTPATREEIEELNAELDETLTELEDSAGLDADELPFVEPVRVASDLMRSTGDRLIPLVTRRQDLDATLETLEESFDVIVQTGSADPRVGLIGFELIAEAREFFSRHRDETKGRDRRKSRGLHDTVTIRTKHQDV